MSSLISTVQSIGLAAMGCEKSLLQSLFKQYCNLVASGLRDNDYSIPSLIWPPPKTENNYYHHTPLLISSGFLIKGDLACL